MQISQTQKWRFTSISILIIFLILVLRIIIPSYQHWFSQIKTLKIKHNQILISEKWQQELIKLNNEKNRLQNKLKQVSKDYNVLHNLSDAIELVNSKAQENIISISDFHVNNRANIDKYEQIEINLSVKGQFHDLGRFIKNLEKPGNPIKLNNLIIDKHENSLEASINITVTMANTK